MATYYAIRYINGRKKVLERSNQDSFGDTVYTVCSEFLPDPPNNAKRVRSLEINCSDNGILNGYVYVDWHTARHTLQIT